MNKLAIGLIIAKRNPALQDRLSAIPCISTKMGNNILSLVQKPQFAILRLYERRGQSLAHPGSRAFR